MDWRRETKILFGIAAVFAMFYFLPLSEAFPDKGLARFDNAVLEALALVKWHAREHVLLCLVPAFFIAGAVGTFIRQRMVVRHMGLKKGQAMKINILGTGCPKCKALAANAEQAVREAGVEADIEKITDINEIMKFGVMITPALAVDGKVVATGKVLSPEDVKKHLPSSGVKPEGGCSRG